MPLSAKYVKYVTYLAEGSARTQLQPDVDPQPSHT
jgi:hypothetical protein